MRTDRQSAGWVWGYGILLAVALFTGFGNMPLYGRYYVADLPGLAWSGNFFINVQVHYLAGALLLAMACYGLAARLRAPSRRRLSASGRLRAVLLALTLASGIVMAVKNLQGISFSLGWLVASNFIHMGSAVFLLLATLAAVFARRRWTVPVATAGRGAAATTEADD